MSAWAGIIMGMGSANERWRYIVTSYLIGWASTLMPAWAGIILGMGSANERWRHLSLAEPIPRMIPEEYWKKLTWTGGSLYNKECIIHIWCVPLISVKQNIVINVLQQCVLLRCPKLLIHWLTHWGRDKIDTILQTTFSNAFSWMKMYEFCLLFRWSLFLSFELTIFQHWFR